MEGEIVGLSETQKWIIFVVYSAVVFFGYYSYLNNKYICTDESKTIRFMYMVGTTVGSLILTFITTAILLIPLALIIIFIQQAEYVIGIPIYLLVFFVLGKIAKILPAQSPFGGSTRPEKTVTIHRDGSSTSTLRSSGNNPRRTLVKDKRTGTKKVYTSTKKFGEVTTKSRKARWEE